MVLDARPVAWTVAMAKYFDRNFPPKSRVLRAVDFSLPPAPIGSKIW